ncbi:MAG: YrdB family protein [Bauldia sp.]|nr:YrdB family protein [Bauldia sp.]
MIEIANYVLRFGLEVAALVAAAVWGFTLDASTLVRILAGVGVPVALGALWAVFRIPNDGGRPVIEVAPRIRLLVEAVVLGVATALLFASGRQTWGIVFAALIVIHYAIGWRRTAALVVNRQPPPIPEMLRPR